MCVSETEMEYDAYEPDANLNPTKLPYICKKRVTEYLHENYKEETHIHRQVKQIPNEFQVKREDWFPLPLSLHKHVTDIEKIFYKNRHGCCCEYHVPEIETDIM